MSETLEYTPPVGRDDPVTQGLVERYDGMPVERLHEVVGMIGSTPQGQIAREVLQRKLAFSGQQAATGGAIKRAMGGMMPRQAAGAARGYLGGPSLGRADNVHTGAPPGSYVLPADIIAGLGDGNNLAGAHIAELMFGTAPFGISMPRGGGGRGLPSPPAPSQVADGGMVQPEGDDRVAPVLLSDGEYVIDPETVRKIGGGDMKRGHRILDAFVLTERRKHIRKLKKLPGPVKTR